MAAVGSTQHPLIIEPTASPNGSSPGSLPTATPNPSSSSNSFNSSRPQSSCSNTSQSNLSPSPRENPKDIPLQELTGLASSTLPDIDPLPPPSTLLPATQTPNAYIPPRSVPLDPSGNSNPSSTTTTSSQNSWFRSFRTRLHERRWPENMIGALGLATALWLGVRGYKLAVWQSWNELRQLCSSYQQVSGLPSTQIRESSHRYRTIKS